MERKLIAAALQDRDAFDAVAGSAEVEHFEESLQAVYTAARGFYARDPEARAIDVEVLCAGLETGALNPRKGRELAELARSVYAEGVSTENVRHLLLTQARDRRGMALAAAIAGRRPAEEIQGALDAFLASAAPDDPEKDTEAPPRWADALRSRVNVANRAAVSPRVLNEHLGGGVCPGHNITIFGRPESGKTALAITLACGFARRGKRVLYVGNEDPIQDIMVRAITNLTGATLDEIAQDPDGYEARALAAGGANMVMRSTAPGTMREVEALVKQHKPDVLVLDQLRNIASSKADNYTQLLDKNAQGIRALGKKYGVITVSVTQAGDSASGKAVLDMGDVDSSNTGIPGAADVMIGVGVTDALDRSGQRMLSLCKNKLGRHATLLVSFDPFRSKMK